MKKALLLLLSSLIVIVLSASVLAASVSRDMPSRVSAGDEIRVTLSASDVPVGELFTIEDQAPQGWRVDNWDVTGAEGGKTAVVYRFVAQDNRHGFSFTAESSNPVVSFDVKVPNSAATGDYSFDAVYFDSSGQARNQATVTVRVVTCGDGICEGSETSETCLVDCPAPPPEEEKAPEDGDGEGGISGTGVFVIVIIVIIGLLAYFFIAKKKKA